MKLLVNGTELNVVNAYVEQTTSLVLKVVVANTEITATELKALFKENTDDITLTHDDGSVEYLCGFRNTCRVADYGDEEYIAEVECVGDAEYQLGRVRSELDAQMGVIEEQAKLIGEQSNLIAEQTTMIDDLMSAMDETLTTIIPEMITEMVTVMVEEKVAELIPTEEVVEEIPTETVIDTAIEEGEVM